MANPRVMNGTVIPLINLWPKRTEMESLFDGIAASTTRCYTCGGLVYAVEQKKTANHTYHNRCFRCRICKRGLTGSSLNEEGDEIYCTNCYRKKQRGDCNSLDFKRAATERAQYVHNPGHPDQPPPSPNPRPPMRSFLSRHPSTSLHQMERRFLSYREPKTKDSDDIQGKPRRLISLSHPVTLNTSFSAPGYLINNRRRNSSVTTDDSSLHFLPVFSPYINGYSESRATTPKTSGLFNSDRNNHITNSIQSRSSRSSIDTMNGRTTPVERNHSIIFDVDQKYQNTDKNATKFIFPDKYINPSHRRSSSLNHMLNSNKYR